MHLFHGFSSYQTALKYYKKIQFFINHAKENPGKKLMFSIDYDYSQWTEILFFISLIFTSMIFFLSFLNFFKKSFT